MSVSLRKPACWFILGIVCLLPAEASGQIPRYWDDRCPAPCPAPAAPVRPVPVQPEPGRPAEAIPQPALTEERFAALAGETAAVAPPPNMIGDLLGASRSIFFVYHRAAGAVDVESGGFTTISNAKVAENNSPLPQDRIAFRYNHFHNALAIGGIGTQTVPGPFPGTVTQLTTTRDYDVDAVTFSGEKTFGDGRFSVEARVPFTYTLASDLDLAAGQVVGFTQIFPIVAPTPESTLGEKNFELGNISVILKALVYEGSRWAVSGGLGIGIPTAEDVNVRVTDFFGFVDSDLVLGSRQRDFRIENETWSLSPFLAVLVAPNDRWFAQGFLQVDFPVGDSKVSFSENVSFPIFNPVQPGTLTPPFSVGARVDEQILMHADIGVGFWAWRDPSARLVTGVAPTLELHYTTTLEDADIVTLPGDTLIQRTRPDPNNITGFALEPNPKVGNLRNRVDLLNLTIGTTFELGNRATLAAAVAVPLRDDDDRVFDFEAQLQFNYRFGGPSRWFGGF